MIHASTSRSRSLPFGVDVALHNPATGEDELVRYYVGESFDGSPDNEAAVQAAESDHPGFFYEDWSEA